MNFKKSLAIKFAMVTAVLLIVLGMFNGMPFGSVLFTSVVLTGIAFCSDLVFLKIAGNRGALITDFVLIWSVVAVIGLGYNAQDTGIGTAAFFSALFITFGEYFLHRYMQRTIYRRKRSRGNVAYFPTRYFQTEFSSETHLFHRSKPKSGR